MFKIRRKKNLSEFGEAILFATWGDYAAWAGGHTQSKQRLVKLNDDTTTVYRIDAIFRVNGIEWGIRSCDLYQNYNAGYQYKVWVVNLKDFHKVT